MVTKNKFILVLIAILLFYGITNWLWIRSCPLKFPFLEFPMGITGTHYPPLLECYEEISSVVSSKGSFDFRQLGFIFKDKDKYPSLLLAISATWCLILGRSGMSIPMSNLLYIAILLIGVYYIAKKISGPGAGILSMVIVSLFPGIYGPSRIFIPETGEAAFVCLSICFLLYSEDFKNRKYSILFGLSCGLGMLTHSPFITFIIGPAFFVAGKLIISVFKSKKRAVYLKQILNIIIALALVLLIAGDFYLIHKRYKFTICNVFQEPVAAPVTFYIDSLIHSGITLPYFILFLWGIFVFFKSRDIKERIIFPLWILIPALIYTFMPHFKVSRYAIPYLPAIGIITGVGISKIKVKLLKNMIVGLAIFCGLLYYFDLSYGFNLIPEAIKSFPKTVHYRVCYHPERNEMLVKIKNEYILPEIGRKRRKIMVLFVASGGVAEQWRLWKVNFWGEYLDKQVEMNMLDDGGVPYKEFFARLFKKMEEADFIVSPFDITHNGVFERLVEETRVRFGKSFIRRNESLQREKEEFLRLRLAGNFKLIEKCDSYGSFLFQRK